MNRFSSLGMAAFLVLVTACGGGQSPEPAVPAPAPSGPETAPAAPTAWSDDLPMDQRAAFMKAHVAPRLGKVFQAMDASHFSSFGCKTCHGPAMKEPSEFLPHLTMKNGTLTAFSEKPEVAKFMAEKVVPEMASALGKPPFDPATHKGFGCAGCHTIDTK